MLLRGLEILTPGVPIDSEECGISAPVAEGSAYWVVDPLDGSQNFAFGLPLAGVAVSLVRDGRVVMAGAADVFTGRVLLAEEGGAVQHRDKVSSVDRPVDRSALAARRAVGRVSLLRGSRTENLHGEYLDALVRLNDRYSRVYETRSPVTDLFLYLRGGTDAFIGLSLTGYETPAVIFLAQRLGLELFACSPTVGGPWQLPDRLLLARPQDVEEYLKVLEWECVSP
jgi:myo-inositol-1(or 4)-monophosphatase